MDSASDSPVVVCIVQQWGLVLAQTAAVHIAGMPAATPAGSDMASSQAGTVAGSMGSFANHTESVSNTYALAEAPAEGEVAEVRPGTHRRHANI